MKTQLKIDGMSCGHCVAAVKRALESVEGVQGVAVDLETGAATVEHHPSVAVSSMERVVLEEGYQVRGA